MKEKVVEFTNMHGLRFSKLPFLIGLALSPACLHAQSKADDASSSSSADNAPPGADGEATTLESVTVTGIRGSIQKSLVDKRNAPGIVDAISAEDMGKFPDLNLSESLQRIPGVTLDRNSNGEGRAINLRGLGPEFTRVEINGMSGVSNGTGGRFGQSEGGRGFNFEIFASELFSKATVYKTGMAEIDEGGLAGTVRLETPRPLDREGTSMSATALANYSDIGGKIDPRLALLVSHNKDDVFGIAASVAYSSTRFASNAIEAGSWRPFTAANTGTRASDDVRAAWNANGPRYYVFNEDRDTLGTTLTLQFRPTDTLLFTLDGLYGKLDSNRLALRNDMAIEGGANAPTDVTIDQGVITSGSFTGIQQRVGANFYQTDETYQQITGSLEWTPDEYWTIRPFIGMAEREADRTWDLYSFRLADNGVFDPGVVSYRVRGDFLDFGSTATNFDANPEAFLFNVFVYRPSRDKDTEHQARIDLTKRFADSEHALKFGLRYNDRTKDRTMSQWRLQRDASTPATAIPGLGSAYDYVDFHVSGGGRGVPDRMLSVDPHALRQAFFPGGDPVEGTRVNNMTGYAAQQSYSINEKTASAYLQADLVFGKLTLIPGVRYVRTEQASSGFQVANLFQPTQRITPVAFAKTYDGFLPGLTARYDVSEKVVLRAAYARTLTRPNLADLAPSETVAGIDASGGQGTRGNPDLDPYYADNFDVGAEWYFSSEGMLAAGLFRKDISGFIDTHTFTENRTFPRQSDGVLVTGPIIFTEPVNGVSARIQGFELSAQSRLSGLPGALGNMGAIVNYTYTESSADFAAAGDVRSKGLPGLSKNSVNAVLYYDDGRFDARLAYAWRDRYLAQFSDDFGIPRFTQAYGQLDLSANYKVSKNFSIQAQVLNLTRAQNIDQSTARFLPYGVADIDRRILLGARVTF